MEGGDGYKRMSLSELIKMADESISQNNIPEAKKIRDYLLSTDYFMSAGHINRKIMLFGKPHSQ
jgi:hypothetical protein